MKNNSCNTKYNISFLNIAKNKWMLELASMFRRARKRDIWTWRQNVTSGSPPAPAPAPRKFNSCLISFGLATQLIYQVTYCKENYNLRTKKGKNVNIIKDLLTKIFCKQDPENVLIIWKRKMLTANNWALRIIMNQLLNDFSLWIPNSTV